MPRAFPCTRASMPALPLPICPQALLPAPQLLHLAREAPFQTEAFRCAVTCRSKALGCWLPLAVENEGGQLNLGRDPRGARPREHAPPGQRAGAGETQVASPYSSCGPGLPWAPVLSFVMGRQGPKAPWQCLPAARSGAWSAGAVRLTVEKVLKHLHAGLP